MGSAVECGWYTQYLSTKESWFSLSSSYQLQTASWSEGGHLALTFPPPVGIWPHMSLYKCCECGEIVYAPSLLCLENTISLELSTTTGSYNLSFPHPLLHRSLSSLETWFHYGAQADLECTVLLPAGVCHHACLNAQLLILPEFLPTENRQDVNS